MKPTTDQVRRQFGPVAGNYALSEFHARGPDLACLVAEAGWGGKEVVLDLGCGAGHTAIAYASRAARLIGIDVTSEMVAVASALAEKHEIPNVWFQVANAESLPFRDGSFDVVTSRVSAHHFGNVPRALTEAARVLRPGGVVLISDSVTPEDPVLDRFLNEVELLRDPSHVRDYCASEWTEMLAEAGFAPKLIEWFSLDLDGAEWVKRIGTRPAEVARLERLFLEADPAVRAAFQVRDDPWGFTLPLALFRGTKL